jgi:hypothetical protein
LQLSRRAAEGNGGIVSDTEMRGLSLWQPWASLWALGIKKNETRSWATNYRGLVAIHVAKKPIKDTLDQLPKETRSYIRRLIGSKSGEYFTHEYLPLGCILGYGELVDCHLMTPEFIAQQTPQELLLGDWQPGRFAWEVENVKLLAEPMPYKGMQGLWRVPNAEEILRMRTA